MKALGIIAWIILGGVLGAAAFWNFSGLPQQEGYLAMMSVFVGGPIGAVAGVIFGLKMTAKLSEQGARKFVGLSMLVALLLFVGLVALPK